LTTEAEIEAMAYKLKPDPPEKKPTLRQRPGKPPREKKPNRDKKPAEPPRDGKPKPSPEAELPKVERLVSLDAFRGFIMILLAVNGFGIYQLSTQSEDALTWKLFDQEKLEWVAFHFEHPPWQSNFVPGTHDAMQGDPWYRTTCSFWDLIQPSFMFMVGVAMPFSYRRRNQTGDSFVRRSFHALLRSAGLVLLGVFLYSRGDGTNWIFPNVLAQIGLGYFFAYLIMHLKQWAQVVIFFAILGGTWMAINSTPIAEDYDPVVAKATIENGEILPEPYTQWSKNGNAFAQFDTWFLNLFPRAEDDPFVVNNGGYQTLNFVPSIATTLLGIFCGQILISGLPSGRKWFYLVLLGLLCWGAGLAAGATICPIIKRIWSPSWVLFSGGFVIGMLALFYLLFDILPLKALAFPLVVVGMNSLAAYLMGQMLRSWILNSVVKRHFGWLVEWTLSMIAQYGGLTAKLGVPQEQAGQAMMSALGPVVNMTTTFLVMWLILWWMYRQKLFVRL